MAMLRVRIPDELEKHLDQFVETLQKENPATEVSRSSVVRYALEKLISEEENKNNKEDSKMLKIGMEIKVIKGNGVYEDESSIDLTGFVGSITDINDDGTVSVEFGDDGEFMLNKEQVEIN